MKMCESKENSLWDFFKKVECENSDDKKAVCYFCDKTLDYTSTTANLKTHLKRLHSDVVEIESTARSAATEIPRGVTRCLVWENFTKIDETQKIASCMLCSRHLSYRTTIANLKAHLARVHGVAVNQSESFLVVKEEDVLFEVTDEEQTSPAPVWDFFEVSGGKTHCVYCRAVVRHREDNLKRHLKENHPHLVSQNSESEHESSQEIEGDVFTEVIYLDDDGLHKTPRKRTYEKSTRKPQAETKRRKLTERKDSSSSDEVLVKLNENKKELKIFGDYITSLLKNMPQDECMKLQLDIVNLIMTRKLKVSQDKKMMISVRQINKDEGDLTQLNQDKKMMISLRQINKDEGDLTQLNDKGSDEGETQESGGMDDAGTVPVGGALADAEFSN